MKKIVLLIGIGGLVSQLLISQNPSPSTPPVQAPATTQSEKPEMTPTPEATQSQSINQNVLEVHSHPHSSPLYQPTDPSAPTTYNLNENRTYRTVWK